MKYLLLKHYRGAPVPQDFVTMDQWTPEELNNHFQFMRDFAAKLEESGEFVSADGLAPTGAWVQYGGEGKPPVTDGPFAETKDLIAGWMIIDVESQERAYAVACGAVGCAGQGRGADPRVARGPPGHVRAADRHGVSREAIPVIDADELRRLTPQVLGILVRRGADFAAAEDAVQEALVQAVRTWPEDPPRDPKAWLVTVAWRKFLDATRADASRRQRESLVEEQPAPEAGSEVDDTLQLYFLCAHPALTPASAVALTLRAVGGLSTRQIAEAYLVPEATMSQRITRAKKIVADVRWDQAGDVGTVVRVLYLVFNEGYSGEVDLAVEAIRLTRQLAASLRHPEVDGLLALMLLHHARRTARTDEYGNLVPLASQDRSRWDTAMIAEGVEILQAALARDQLGEFQAQAAIAALHADAQRAEETDWVQILGWYDELVRLTDSPVVRLNRVVAVGEVDGPRARLAALGDLDPSLPRYTAVAAYLHEQDGNAAVAARLYAEAAHGATNQAERDHLTRQAARLNASR